MVDALLSPPARGRCVQGAAVQLGHAQARTSRHGTASLKVDLSRPGIYRLAAHKPGCRSGDATIVAAG